MLCVLVAGNKIAQRIYKQNNTFKSQWRYFLMTIIYINSHPKTWHIPQEPEVFFTTDIWWSLMIRWLCSTCNWTCWNTCFPDTQGHYTIQNFLSLSCHFSVFISGPSHHLGFWSFGLTAMASVLNLFSRFSPAMIPASLYEIIYILMIPTFSHL